MPDRDRPSMPGYGIETGSAGLLEWSWAEERLETSRCFWVATVWPDGHPQVLPVWGAWLDGALWFSSSRTSRRARNLAADPRCTVTTEDPHQPVVLEGSATLVEDRAAVTAYAIASDAKYDVAYGADFYLDQATFRVVPTKVLALDDAAFSTSPTRWRF